MPSLQLSSLFRGRLTQMSVMTSVPLSLLLLGLQAMIDIKFSCPCKVHWNGLISALICIAPAMVALVIMFFLLRPFKYKCGFERNKYSCHKKTTTTTDKHHKDRKTGPSQEDISQDRKKEKHHEDNTKGPSQEEDISHVRKKEKHLEDSTKGPSQEEDISPVRKKEKHLEDSTKGPSQEQDKKDISQSEKNEIEENMSCGKTFAACLTLVWICLWFIDGDYLACANTYWDGHYTCDKELHPNCLNWCKPNELSQGKTENAYEDTRMWIRLSKTLGYSLAVCFSFAAIVYVSLDCREKWKIKKTDLES